MESMVVWFEIPVVDFERASKFYSRILDFEITAQEMGEDLMGFFPMEGWENSGAIVRGPNNRPASEGPLIYLHGGEDLGEILDRVEEAGGKIIQSKTLVNDDIGFIAYFLDTEGNRIGLWSKN